MPAHANGRVWIVTLDEPVWYNRMYVRLLAHYPEHFGGVIVIAPRHAASLRAFTQEVFYRIGLWGITGFTRACGRLLRARISGSGDIVSAAGRADLDVYLLANIREARSLLLEHRPHVVLATVQTKVPGELLELVPGGWVNTHCGPLPRYAGVDAPFWCLLHGEKEVAVTLHYMEPEFDCGPIVAQHSIPTPSKRYFQVVDRLFEEAYDLHCRYMETRAPTPSEARPQDKERRTYFSKPTAPMGRKFRRTGGSFT